MKTKSQSYYIHTRSLDPGAGICLEEGRSRLVPDSFGTEYCVYNNKKEAEEARDQFNEEFPASDLIVCKILEETDENQS